MKESRDFHYYLCRQLKGGGMEILMKKILLSFIVIVLCFFAFSGLSASAAKSYEAPDGNLYAECYYYRCFYENQYYDFKIWTNFRISFFEGPSTQVFSFQDKSSKFVQLIVNNIEKYSSDFYVVCNGSHDVIPDFIFYTGYGTSANTVSSVESNIPFFKDYATHLAYQIGEYDLPVTPDSGSYDKDLGYLIGISERSSILDLLKDKDNSIGSDIEQFNRVFKIGWGSKTSTGVDLSGSDKYEDLQVQAKIKVYGHFVSLITGDLTRGIPDVDDYHDFDYIPADSYSMRFELLDDLQIWFIDFFNYVYSDAKFLEKPVVMADLYLRVFGSNLNDDLCVGPWVKVSFYVMNGVGKSDTHVVVTGGDEFDDNGNLVVDSSSPYGDGLSTDFGYGSGFTESDAYNNLIRDSENQLNVTFESLMKDVGNLPAIISKLFSFLPSWCLSLLSLAFSLSIVILIWKVAT